MGFLFQREFSLAAARLVVAMRMSALAFLIAGCAHSPKEEVARSPASQPPLFLVGPTGLLLTNAVEGFSAQVVVTGDRFSSGQDFNSGQLLGRGSKLFFVPDFNGSAKARNRAGGVSFIWDAAQNRGFVVSEALQAYAPCTFGLRATNLVVTAGKTVPQKIEGHWCEEWEATVQMSDGSTARFQVFRAADLKGLPMRINSVTNAMPLTISLSKIRLEPPPTDAFVPPNGFTKYETAEAMMDELAVRQGSLKRRGTEQLAPPGPSRYPQYR